MPSRLFPTAGIQKPVQAPTGLGDAGPHGKCRASRSLQKAASTSQMPPRGSVSPRRTSGCDKSWTCPPDYFPLSGHSETGTSPNRPRRCRATGGCFFLARERWKPDRRHSSPHVLLELLHFVLWYAPSSGTIALQVGKQPVAERSTLGMLVGVGPWPRRTPGGIQRVPPNAGSWKKPWND